jgi:hypothetical protein
MASEWFVAQSVQLSIKWQKLLLRRLNTLEYDGKLHLINALS